MKKTLVVLPLAALGIALLAGCNGNADAAIVTPMQQEIVSAALLADPTAQNQYLRAKAKATADPILFDPNNIGASLASFDALSLANYGVESSTLTSDKDAYAHEEKIVYTLPDGSKANVLLYYGDPKEVTTQLSASASIGGNQEDGEEGKNLHSFGFRSGAFKGMLAKGMKIKDYKDEANATIQGEWKSGLAVVESTEYRFYSEHLKVSTMIEGGNAKESEFSSFGLFNGSSFLAIEQVTIADGTAQANAYAYTSFQKGGYVRFLLSEEESKARFVYLSPSEKIVINRYVEDQKTLYSVHIKVSGSMSFVGIYEKKTTTAEDGTETVSYELVSKNESKAPEED